MPVRWSRHASDRTMSTINIENPAQAAAPPAKGIQVTDKALARIRAAHGEGEYFAYRGRTASGRAGWRLFRTELQHPVRHVSRANAIGCFMFDDVRIFVDPKSFIYLHGMVLDYEETLMHQGFVFRTQMRRSLAAAALRFS